MALNPKYIVASDLEQYFVDKDTGLPLANGTLTFYRDISRNTAKPVYQLSGNPPNYSYASMGAQINLSAVGTVQNNGGDNEVIYYYPYITDPDSGLDVLDLYYVVCKNQDGVEQFTREAWPNIADAGTPAEQDVTRENQVSNPTFTNVFINEGLSTIYTASSAVNKIFAFAPDWDFVISGTGTVTVQRFPISGNDNVPTSPPYVIDVTVGAGITSCFLRQTYSYNSGLWASTTDNDIYLSGSFLARNEVGGTQTIQMFYEESTGGSPIQIVSGSFASNYEIITGGTTNPIPTSSNIDEGQTGYVDIYLSFPINSHTRVTAIQVIPSFIATQVIPYDLNSSNRNEAFQGDYYIPRLNAKAIPNYLIGWDFAFNPFQLGTSGSSLPNNYIADQTIAGESVGTVLWDQDNGNLHLGAVAGGTFYLMQYLSEQTVLDLRANRLSVNVNAFKPATFTDQTTIRVYLCQATSGGIPTLPTIFGTLSATGEFTITDSDWTFVDRSGLDTAQAVIRNLSNLDQVKTSYTDYSFTGWSPRDDIENFAIIVSVYAPTGLDLNIRSISLVPGDIPCRPAPQTPDEVLRECQYFYSQSFPPGIVAGQNRGAGASYGIQVAGASTSAIGPIVRFATPMRAKPVITLYNPEATNAEIRDSTTNTDWSSSTAPIGNVTVCGFTTTGTTPGGSAGGNLCEIHWSADARLGVVV